MVAVGAPGSLITDFLRTFHTAAAAFSLVDRGRDRLPESPLDSTTYARRMARVHVYVDGFNLYHGLKEMAGHGPELTQWKWLDINALSQRLAPHDDVVGIRYFTARVKFSDVDAQKQDRQQVFLRALHTLPNVTVHYGTFLRKKKRVPLVDELGSWRYWAIRRLGLDLKRHADGGISIPIWKVEEKGSDVNLATYLLLDAFNDHFDRALLFTNDTDLCEPVRLVVQSMAKEVFIVNPRGHSQPAAALKKVASGVRTLRAAAVVASQFSNPMTDSVGEFTKPADW